MESTLSELRKEVAHKLAAIGSSFEMRPEQQMYTPMGFLAFITLDDVKAEPIEVMAALSDLIDPTCHVQLVEKSDVWLVYACSECGMPVDGGDKYCSNCGARIVEEDQ